MNLEILLAVVGALGGLEAVKWWATRRSTGRSAVAEADSAQTQALAAREHLYEDTITFLQNQLRDKEERFAALNAQLHKSMASELLLTRQLGEMEVKYLSSRCDIVECLHRHPPLPGRNVLNSEEDNNG